MLNGPASGTQGTSYRAGGSRMQCTTTARKRPDIDWLCATYVFIDFTHGSWFLGPASCTHNININVQQHTQKTTHVTVQQHTHRKPHTSLYNSTHRKPPSSHKLNAVYIHKAEEDEVYETHICAGVTPVINISRCIFIHSTVGSSCNSSRSSSQSHTFCFFTLLQLS